MYILNNNRLFQLSHITEIWFNECGVYCEAKGVQLLGQYNTYDESKRAFDSITSWIATNRLADKGVAGYQYQEIFTMPKY